MLSIIENRDLNKIYIGQTEDLENRLWLHSSGVFKNSFTAKNKGNWILIYSEKTKDRKTALLREKQLKSYQGRQYIKKFIG